MGDFMLNKLIANGPVEKMITLPRGHQRLHAMPTSTGYEIRTNRLYAFDGRKRSQKPFTVLQYTLKGAGNLRYENRLYRLQPGDAFLVLVPHNHRYWCEDGGYWEYFWLSFNGEEALRIHREILNVTGPVLKLKPKTLDCLAACSLRLIAGEAQAAGRASSIAYEAIMALYDDVFGARPIQKRKNHSIEHVITHIDKNLAQPLRVAELARISGLSRAHFSRTFSASEGMSPAEFVLQKRLAYAAKLLTKAGRLSIKDVSSLSGFDDPNYFAKAFRRHFGLPPSEFRMGQQIQSD